MRRRATYMAAVGGLAALAALAAGPASAQSVADFYRGKTITIYVGASAGGGYGIYAQAAAEFMGRHIPGNPAIITKFMQGGAGMKAANYIYSVAPQDGTTLGAVLSVQPTMQLLNRSAARYDAAKFHWLGRMADTISVMTVKRDAPATTVAAMREREIVAGAANVGDNTYAVPVLMNYAVGTKIKVVTGYDGSNGAMLAYERGEVHAVAVGWESLLAGRAHFLKDIQLVQFGLDKHPDYPNVPLLSDLATDAKKKAVVDLMAAQGSIGRSLIAAPGATAERVAALRAAFDAMMKDPEFLAAAKKRNMQLTYLSGAKLQELVEEHLRQPADIVQIAKDVTGMK